MCRVGICFLKKLQQLGSASAVEVRHGALFSRAFRVGAIETDSPEAASEVRGYDELVVGLPKDNLTILDLARRIAAAFARPQEAPDASRKRLAQVVRHQPASITSAWLMASTKSGGIETASAMAPVIGDRMPAANIDKPIPQAYTTAPSIGMLPICTTGKAASSLSGAGKMLRM